MKNNHSIIIMGGGVIGLACAHYLSSTHDDILVIDQGAIGSGASHGNCGLLHFSGVIPLCAPGVLSNEIFRMFTRSSPLYIKPRPDPGLMAWLIRFALNCNRGHMHKGSAAKNALLTHSSELFTDLFSDPDFLCELDRKGVLITFKDPRKFEQYQKTNDWLAGFGFGGTPLSPSELAQKEPGLSPDLAGAWLNTHDWHLRPETLLQSWRTHLSKKGVRFLEYAGVEQIHTQDRTLVRAATPKGEYTADIFILCTGAWSGRPLPGVPLDLPVQPGKGYSITMTRPEPCLSHPCLLYERNMVITPFESGYRLGGTMEFSGFNLDLDPERLSRLAQGARDYLAGSPPRNTPAITIEEWAGWRPMTFDDLPIIDRAHPFDNLYVATGHGMLGVTMATGTGKAVSDLIDGRTSAIDLTPFSMSRF